MTFEAFCHFFVYVIGFYLLVWVAVSVVATFCFIGVTFVVMRGLMGDQSTKHVRVDRFGRPKP